VKLARIMMNANIRTVEASKADPIMQIGPRRRQKATAELESQVIRLRRRGLTSGQIHRLICGALSVSVILRICARDETTPPRPRRTGPTEMSRRGFPLRRFTAEDDARIEAIAAAAARDKQIAVALGRRQSSIADRRRILARRTAIRVLVVGPNGPAIAAALDRATAGKTRSTWAVGAEATSPQEIDAAAFVLLTGDWFDHLLELIRRFGFEIRDKCIALAPVEHDTVTLLFSVWRLSPATLCL